MSSNKRKNLLLIALVFCCCMLSVGYLSLINTIVVEGNLKLEPAVWDINFKSMRTLNTVGKAENYKKPMISPKVIDFYAKFSELGDSITYEIHIKNEGNLDAKLENITFYPIYMDTFEYNCELKKGTVLKAGRSLSTKLNIKYVKSGNTIKKDDVTNFKLILNWEQDD